MGGGNKVGVVVPSQPPWPLLWLPSPPPCASARWKGRRESVWMKGGKGFGVDGRA